MVERQDTSSVPSSSSATRRTAASSRPAASKARSALREGRRRGIGYVRKAHEGCRTISIVPRRAGRHKRACESFPPDMDLLTFSAVLGAAVLHAGWNAVVKVGLDRFSSILLLGLFQSAIALALVP